MLKKLREPNPYVALCSDDPYTSGIFDATLNGILSVVERVEQDRTVLIEKSFQNESGQSTSSGYCFIQCLDCSCEEEHLRRFRSLLEEVVRRKTRGNYMEVEPILVAAGFSKDVSNFVDQYNRLQRRKPIQLFSYEA